jgi:hypothetical protein
MRVGVQVDYKKMIEAIDEIVSTDWGYSVTDDMIDASTGKIRKPFTPEQAQEMSDAIGRIYMIAHAVHCTACQRKWLL